MPEKGRLSGRLDYVDEGVVEREATPAPLMKFSNRLHPVKISISHTVSFFEIVSVDRVRSIVRNGVHKSDPQPDSDRRPNHVAVDETAIRRDGERYRLYAAVHSESKYPLRAKLEPTGNGIFVDWFCETA